MARSRADLSTILHGFCDHVYFQPPGGHSLEYPCIIYALNDISKKSANNRTYKMDDEYTITYITRNPDDDVIHGIAELPMCSMSSVFTSENLHHYRYTLYF